MTSGEYVATHKTTPPPPPLDYAAGVREQAQKLREYGERILARARELEETARYWEAER